MTDFTTMARAVLDIERDAIQALADRINEEFTQACELVLACQGRVVVTGMGKSGHIGSKIAATLASTGTPAFFVHPGEASHGDMGMITRDDVIIALSNSGETNEVLTIVPLIKRLGAQLIAMTGRPDSALATAANVHLDVSVEVEACPLGLAPTASTTAALAMGDALAVALLNARGFSAEDFALSHPGGALGRRLLVHVKDAMHSGDELPLVGLKSSLPEVLLEVTNKGIGLAIVLNDDQTLAGVFTDGDLRRALEVPRDIHQVTVDEIMTVGGRTIGPDVLAAEALEVMERHKINALVVVNDKNHVVGVLNTHDLMNAGVV